MPKDTNKMSFPTNIKGKFSDNDTDNPPVTFGAGKETTNDNTSSVKVKKQGERMNVKRKSSNIPTEATTSF